MTAPVNTDDLVSGCADYLLSQPDIIAVVSKFLINGVLSPGVFQYRPWAKVEGSSGTAIVLSAESGGWAAANLHNTMTFPRLTVNIWTDPIRDGMRNVTDPGEVMRRAFSVQRIVDRFLHRTAGPEIYFGSLRILSSHRLTEPFIYVVPDGDGLVRSQTQYAITEG